MKVELSHDSLAKKIYQLASNEDKTLLKMRAFVESRYAHFQENHIWLTQDDINYISPYLNQIQISTEEAAFIRRSRRNNNKRLIITIAGGIFSLLVLTVITLISFSQWTVISDAKDLQEDQLNKLEAALKKRKDAEDLAARILNGEVNMDSLNLNTNNDSLLIKELVILYDTLAKEQIINEKERDIAQSARLSTLAQSVIEVEVKTNSEKKVKKTLLLELIGTSLNLNPENVQALKLLGQISDAKLEDFVTRETNEIINDAAKRIGSTGKLAEAKFSAIFSEGNEIGSARKQGQNILEYIKAEARRMKPKAKKEWKKPSKPQMLEQFKTKPIAQQENIVLPAPSYAYARARSKSKGTPSTDSLTPPGQKVPQKLENRLKDIPCELINGLSAEKWNNLNNPGNKKLISFKYDNNNTLSLKLAKGFDISVEDEISLISLTISNGYNIDFTNFIHEKEDQSLVFRIGIGEMEQLALLNNTVVQIDILTNEETFEMKLNLIYQANLKRATTCFFGQ